MFIHTILFRMFPGTGAPQTSGICIVVDHQPWRGHQLSSRSIVTIWRWPLVFSNQVNEHLELTWWVLTTMGMLANTHPWIVSQPARHWIYSRKTVQIRKIQPKVFHSQNWSPLAAGFQMFYAKLNWWAPSRLYAQNPFGWVDFMTVSWPAASWDLGHWNKKPADGRGPCPHLGKPVPVACLGYFGQNIPTYILL
jgi:hypothetical protein